MNFRLTIASALATTAASFALIPVVQGGGWWWAGLGATLVAALVGTLTRVRKIPAVLCLLAGLVAECLYLNALFAGSQSWRGFIPTGRSLRAVGVLIRGATTEMAKYAPPVQARLGMSLVIAAGIAVTAVVTDLIAVRLQRPALAGLPLLVLFCVPLTTSADTHGFGSAFVFCLAMAGYLTLLAADGKSRLRVWGQIVRRYDYDDDEAPPPDTRLIGAAGRRLGFTAVILAVCVPLLLPGLRHHPLFGNSGTGHGGSAPLSLPEPLVQLNRQLRAHSPQTVLTYHSTAQLPPYLQVYVLGRLGTATWSLAPPGRTVPLGSGPLPPVPGLRTGSKAVTVLETISLGSTLTSAPQTLAYLPLPYPSRTIQVNGDWRVDDNTLTAVTVGTRLAGLQYSVSSLALDPSQATLNQVTGPTAAVAGYLEYPQAFASLRRLARHITVGAPTPYDKAVALQNWFRKPGNFTYTLKVSPSQTPDALINFLTKSKKGYCQQFAFGMAVLARLLNIPSRVVVGYTQGSPIGHGNWRVTTSDAHAWPELYFQGAGWLRFEPTPSASPGHPGQATAVPPIYTAPKSGNVSRNGRHASHSPSPEPTGQAGRRGPNKGNLDKLRHLSVPQSGGGAVRQHHQSRPPVGPIALVVLGLLVVTPGAARPITRRVRWLRASGDAERAHAAWLGLRDDLADHRIGSRPSETPRALAGRLRVDLHLTPIEGDALDRIVHAEERAGYAPSAADSALLHDDVRMLRSAMARACPILDRAAAVFAPASVLLPARRGMSAAFDAFDAFGRIDLLGARLRAKVRRRSPGLSTRT